MAASKLIDYSLLDNPHKLGPTNCFLQVKDKSQLEKNLPEGGISCVTSNSKPLLKPTFSLKSVVGNTNYSHIVLTKSTWFSTIWWTYFCAPKAEFLKVTIMVSRIQDIFEPNLDLLFKKKEQ